MIEGESMSEWKEVKLGMLGNIITGKTPRTAIEDNYGGTIPFLTPSDDMSVKHVVFTKKTLSEKGVAEVKNCLLPCGAVCVSCIGSDLGKVVITTGDTITNQQINSIIVNENNNNDFVYYLLTIVGRELNRISKTSTAVPIINKSTFSSYEIKIPDLFTQQEIAGILSSLDAKIETNNKLNEKLEEMAQAIFRSWFVDFEPFKDKPFHETELGMIPEGWNVCCLGDITKQTKEKVGSNRFLKVLSPINTGELTLSEDFFTKQVYSKDISKYILVRKNNFAYNPARVNIGSLGRNEYDFDGCVSPVYVVFEVIKEYENFFDLFRRQKTFINSVISLAIGGVRQSLSYNDFSYIKLVVPPKNVIEKFNDIYSELDKLIKTKKIENERLASLRDTLLPRLMSGELIV